MTVFATLWANRKIILYVLLAIVISGFLVFRNFNSYFQVKQDELIPLKDIKTDSDSADINCLQVSNKRCPRDGK